VFEEDLIGARKRPLKLPHIEIHDVNTYLSHLPAFQLVVAVAAVVVVVVKDAVDNYTSRHTKNQHCNPR
jgi:hypothetical protein